MGDMFPPVSDYGVRLPATGIKFHLSYDLNSVVLDTLKSQLKLKLKSQVKLKLKSQVANS